MPDNAAVAGLVIKPVVVAALASGNETVALIEPRLRAGQTRAPTASITATVSFPLSSAATITAGEHEQSGTWT